MVLNRAAAADLTGRRPVLKPRRGRSAVLPLLIEIVAEALAAGHLGTRFVPVNGPIAPFGDAGICGCGR